MQISAGQRRRSQVDATEVMVVRPSPDDVDLRCGGAPVIDFNAARSAQTSAQTGRPSASPAQLGKRYTDESGSLELLVTKGGTSGLTLGDSPLTIKAAKPLPSSDWAEGRGSK